MIAGVASDPGKVRQSDRDAGLFVYRAIGHILLTTWGTIIVTLLT